MNSGVDDVVVVKDCLITCLKLDCVVVDGMWNAWIVEMQHWDINRETVIIKMEELLTLFDISPLL